MCNTDEEIKMADMFYECAINRNVDKRYNIEFIYQIIRTHLHHYYMQSIGKKNKNSESDLFYLIGMPSSSFDDYIEKISLRYKTSYKDYTSPHGKNKTTWNHGWIYERNV